MFSSNSSRRRSISGMPIPKLSSDRAINDQSIFGSLLNPGILLSTTQLGVVFFNCRCSLGFSKLPKIYSIYLFLLTTHQYNTLRKRKNDWDSVTTNHPDYIRFYNCLWLIANDCVSNTGSSEFQFHSQTSICYSYSSNSHLSPESLFTPFAPTAASVRRSLTP